MKNKRVIAVMAVIGFALATWITAPSAQAKVNIPRKAATAKPSGGWTVTPSPPILKRAAVVPPHTCGTIETGAASLVYDFSEAPGSHVAHETLTGYPDDDLFSPAGYGSGVTFTGSTVQFDGHSLLTGKNPNLSFNPLNGNYFICISWQFLRDSAGNLLDPDGYNLWQFGRTSNFHSFIKGMPSYTAVRGTQELNPRLEVVGSGVAGWHTTLVTHTGTLTKMYLDNVLQDTSGQYTGSINLNQSPLSIGGKYELPGDSDVQSDDMCVCKYALVRIGT